MAFSFRQSGNVAQQVRAIAGDQVDKALEAIEAGGDFDETVHRLRKCCKKLKALLKLIRPGFEDYQQERDAVDAVADGLSEARDASVMVTTFHALVTHGGERLAGDVAPAIRALRKKLAARATHLHRQMGQETLLGASAERLEAVRKRVADWRFEDKGFDIVLPGCERIYAQFRKRLKAAQADPSAQALHDWRKATKAHWYHMRMFEPAAPAMLSPLAASLDHLGELLGDHNNIAVLTDWLDTANKGDEKTSALLVDLVAERQAALCGEAFALGDQLAVEKPEAFGRRLHHYWALLPAED